MGQEIERKFLLKNGSWREGVTGIHYRQGYLNDDIRAHASKP
jgi:CYTH domain-containing protein